MTKLNQRQELFCQNIFTGMTATDAAIKAGYSPKFARENCPKLLQNTTIQERLRELNAPVIARVRATKEAKLEKLEEIYGHEPLPETITARDRILAISEHNKMEGDYAPEKHAIIQETIIRFVIGKGYERNKQ